MFDPETFTEDFEVEEEPIESDEDHGPWITHGVVHTGHKPNH